MGIVYEAEQESLGRRVVLKVLPGYVRLDPKLRRAEPQGGVWLGQADGFVASWLPPPGWTTRQPDDPSVPSLGKTQQGLRKRFVALAHAHQGLGPVTVATAEFPAVMWSSQLCDIALSNRLFLRAGHRAGAT